MPDTYSHDRHEGFVSAKSYPLFSAIFNRRSRRISKGLKTIRAGTLTYTSTQQPQPLEPLEEAVLIAVTGATGLTFPDRPFETPEGEKMLGSPNLNMWGRAAGSPDNAQATHFFLLNDSGTYFIRRLPPLPNGTEVSAQLLIERATQSKVKVLDKRLDFPRTFPYYLDSNRFLSNLPGTTVLVPVVDTTRQYINGILYLLTEPDGHRPTFIDDHNFYLPAGVKKWIKNGFLNPKIKLPLGALGTFRSDIEADLLLQNLVLTLQAIGLGGWIHASITPQYLLGHPMFGGAGAGLSFRFEIPRFNLFDILRWGTFLPKARANPVGLGELIQCLCPPYCHDMTEAVDQLIASKYGEKGVYRDSDYFEQIFQPGLAEKYMTEVPSYTPEAIACTKDVCNYIYNKHGRFPAHVNAIHVPGVWVQAHHMDLDYYDKLFRGSYPEQHARHQERWHSEKS